MQTEKNIHTEFFVIFITYIQTEFYINYYHKEMRKYGFWADAMFSTSLIFAFAAIEVE
jgi:hypothetical protein